MLHHAHTEQVNPLDNGFILMQVQYVISQHIEALFKFFIMHTKHILCKKLRDTFSFSGSHD